MKNDYIFIAILFIAFANFIYLVMILLLVIYAVKINNRINNFLDNVQSWGKNIKEILLGYFLKIFK